MPLAAESLNPNSSPEQIQEAISKSIETCMQEGGRTQEQCAAIAYSYARTATGKELNYGS